MKHKLIIVLFALSAGLLFGCGSAKLSTPENNYEAQYAAIKTKNYKLFAQCFANTEPYDDKNLRILADKLFNDIDIISHRIITRENIDDYKATILAEEIAERKRNKIRTKYVYKINYKKFAGSWKIISSETISFEKIPS